MLDQVDKHVETRLTKIRRGGQPVKVYPHGPWRLQGETVFPCLAVSSWLLGIDLGLARPCCEVFTPSQEQVTIQVPDIMGGGTIAGPARYEVKPYPTPWEVMYQVDLLATDKGQYAALLPMVMAAIPIGHQMKINGHVVSFVTEKPQNLDGLDKPEFRTAFRWTAKGVWIDSPHKYTVAAIRELNFEIDSER